MFIADGAIWVQPPGDNVAIATRFLPGGTIIHMDGFPVHLSEDIPRGHRFAIRDVAEGEYLTQYQQPFARSAGIRCGERVKSDNTSPLGSEIEAMRTERSLSPLPPWIGDKPNFLGFLRPDGNAGVRNWVLVIPTSMCASHEARMIAETAEANGIYSPEQFVNVDGVTSIPHTQGCGCLDMREEMVGFNPISAIEATLWTLLRYAAHPNVGAVLLVELGCEKTSVENFLQLAGCRTGTIKELAETLGKPVEAINIQTCGGTKSTIRAGLECVEKLLPLANLATRQPISIERLGVGLKCGASDAFSGLSANPALGEASDLLIRAGGRSVITEIPEFFGAAHLIAFRAISDPVEKQIWLFMERYREYLARFGGSFEDNPSKGNRAAGLMNIVIKSLGAISKAGKAPVMGVLEPSDSVWDQPQSGLYLLYGPGYDQKSTPALVSAGCQLVVFTTGRGTGIGNAIAPVIKIASNSELAQRMPDDIDLNAGEILSGRDTHAKMGKELFECILAVASGQRVKAEHNHHREFAIWSEEQLTV